MNSYFKFCLSLLLSACFLSCKQECTGFINQEQHQANLKKIQWTNAQMLKQLAAYGVSKTSGLSLDFYFVTNDSLKAQHLADELEKSGSHSNPVHRSSKDKGLWVLTANSSRVNMDSISLNNWTATECELGYKNDCQFQGWSPVTE